MQHGMTQGAATTDTGGEFHMQEGDTFECSNCGCRITLEHHGDPARMPNMRPFTCCCGTQMTKQSGGAHR